jgi:thiol:disulfide interchange protein
METQFFPKAPVQQELDKFLKIKLYTDDKKTGSKNTRIQLERYNSTALPLYVILTPDGKEVSRLNKALFDVDQFAEFLREGHRKATLEK